MSTPYKTVLTAILLYGRSQLSLAEDLDHSFRAERHTAASGTLYASSGFATDNDDLVTALLVDSQGHVWVGTYSGLAVYDGNSWETRSFPLESTDPFTAIALPILGVSTCGPDMLVEGSHGTIWLGGRCGVWRYMQSTFERVADSPGEPILDMAVDRQGALWVVGRQNAYKYKEATWTTVLCPYVGKPRSSEAPGLVGIVIDADQHVWVGATAYGVAEGPWVSRGAVWVVDQATKQRSSGPPMVPVYEFDQQHWHAHGPPQGLNVRWARPVLAKDGQVRLITPKGEYMYETDTWTPTGNEDVADCGRWSLREHRRGISSFCELLYVDGLRKIAVHPIDVNTGGVAFNTLEQLPLLHLIQDGKRKCVWLGTSHGLYRVWRAR